MTVGNTILRTESARRGTRMSEEDAMAELQAVNATPETIRTSVGRDGTETIVRRWYLPSGARYATTTSTYAI